VERCDVVSGFVVRSLIKDEFFSYDG